MATKKSSNSAKTELQKIQENNNKTTIELQKLANANTAKTFEYNSKEAQASRQWQTEMSNTSHQREVADLKKAGLNPVLSANQGAQSYTTSSANAQADNSAVSAVAGIKQSETNARSSMYGADQSLKASQAVASAQRYAADRAYQASLASAAAAKYSADRHYEAQRYAVDHQQVNSIGGWLSKNFGTDLANAAKKVLSLDNVKTFVKGDQTYAKAIASKSNFKATDVLNSSGIRQVRTALIKGNFKLTQNNVNLFAKYLFTGNKVLLARLAQASYKDNVSRKYSPIVAAVKYNWNPYHKAASWYY